MGGLFFIFEAIRTAFDGRCSAQVDNRVFALIVFGMYCVTVFFIILSMFFAMVSAAQARTRVSKRGHDRRAIPSTVLREHHYELKPDLTLDSHAGGHRGGKC